MCHMVKSNNTTFIRLIPKKKTAQNLRDFRSISLIGSGYKILANTLAERLKSGEQNAFLKNRQITDASLIAKEMLDGRL